MTKPGIPKGTRDFGPEQVAKRKYIFSTIEDVFRLHGYQAIETPTMENLSTLTGKYGEEGDRLLFKILNNGDFLEKADELALQQKNSLAVLPSISKRGLRYDLTVPFARFVVMNQHSLSFPFKRYQIQPVWRADRPQKGRYQEFYQCDADIVGSNALIYEAELTQIYDSVFTRLQMPVVIKLNHRKILQGIAEVAGIASQFVDMTVAIDKLDKIGMQGVRQELHNRDIADEAVAKITEILAMKELDELAQIMIKSDIGMQGIVELQKVFTYTTEMDLKQEVVFDVTLARGLNYYTGCIFEVGAKDVQIGSIGGGGRYDDLTSIFGLKNVSGVGISFGAERIYDVLEEMDLFPQSIKTGLDVLIVAMDDESHFYGFKQLLSLRKKTLRQTSIQNLLSLKNK